MKKYAYVSLKIGKFIGAKSEDHRKIIDDYAQKGYTYVGFIPTDMTDHGKIQTIDLIFEREA
ncbi:MAG: DUF4177 domain-containing protein [Tissierellia bacterium]|nr:DUF4177 domain-containing protein [Tissierellia bacterium]